MYFFTNNVTTLAAREAQNQKKSSLFGFVFDLHYLCPLINKHINLYHD